MLKIAVANANSYSRKNDIDLLSKLGHQVTDVSSATAIEGRIFANFDLICVDDSFDLNDGYPLTKSIRECNARAAILLAIPSSTEIFKAFSAGVDNYIVKPYCDEELVVIVNSLSRRLK